MLFGVSGARQPLRLKYTVFHNTLFPHQVTTCIFKVLVPASDNIVIEGGSFCRYNMDVHTLKPLLLVLLSALYLSACDSGTSGDGSIANAIGAANSVASSNTSNTPPASNNMPVGVDNSGDNSAIAPPVVGNTDEVATEVVLNAPSPTVSGENTDQTEALNIIGEGSNNSAELVNPISQI
jgi:hypothetical protein